MRERAGIITGITSTPPNRGSSVRPSAAKQSLSRRDIIRWTAAGALSSIAPIAFAEFDSRSLALERFRLPLTQWDAAGLRIAVLADVHMNRPYELALALDAANLAMEEKPDLILMPGDFINSSDRARLSNLAKFLSAFRDAKCPVIATLGNHDYAGAKPAVLVRAFAASPVRLLRNETVEHHGVTIAGFDDAIYDYFRPEFLNPGGQSRSLLAMLHEPDFVSQVPPQISLQVSGHSHGGQICLPSGYPIHTPFGAWKYSDGFYPDARVPLFVTRGIGVTGIPYRVFCRPQVALLTLDSA